MVKLVKLPDGLEFRQIVESDKTELVTFDCDHSDTNDFFRHDVFQYHRKNIGVTFALIKEKKIVSVVTIGMGAIKFPPNRALDIEDVSEKPTQFPALKIGRLATHKDAIKKGHARKIIEITANLAKWFRQIVGCKYIVVDAYPDKVPFYRKLGFETFYADFTGKQTILMYVRLPDNEIPKESGV